MLVCSYASADTLTTATNEPAAVVITGSRFPNAPELAPIGAVVITSAEISNAGIDNVNEAIRKLGGVYARQSSYGTQDYDLDMNGFGTDSQNNLVVLVDGVRLSENEQANALLSSIPVDSVARIEIMHSGSSVLYGDGATGGVINVITKQLGKTPLTGSILAEAGQYNDRAGRVSLAQGGENVNLLLNLSEQKADNFRVNNAVTQKNAGAAVTWYTTTGRYGLRAELARQDSGLAGALTLAQFATNPHQSVTPHDVGSIDATRYSVFAEQTLGSWQFASELSTRERTVKADYVSFNSASTYTGRQTQFTPRLRQISHVDGVTNELVFGIDWMDWNRQVEGGYSLAYATQKSHAGYVRDELKFGQARFSAGVRREVFDKNSKDAIGSDNYALTQTVNAWEVEGSYSFAPEWNLFARTGQSYRVANVDDNSYITNPAVPLLPQLSHDLELGTVLGNANEQVTARWFEHRISNEIYFDPTANVYGANTNLSPTRRQGVALEAKWKLSSAWRVTAQAQHVAAEFTDGVNQGKQLVLVPKNTLSAQINWLSGDGQSAYVGTQWVDTQRYGSDFDNSCNALIPAHATLDARYARTLGAWELALSGDNLSNKKYFTNAYLCQAGIYPDDGRQLKVTLRYRF